MVMDFLKFQYHEDHFARLIYNYIVFENKGLTGTQNMLFF